MTANCRSRSSSDSTIRTVRTMRSRPTSRSGPAPWCGWPTGTHMSFLKFRTGPFCGSGCVAGSERAPPLDPCIRVTGGDARTFSAALCGRPPGFAATFVSFRASSGIGSGMTPRRGLCRTRPRGRCSSGRRVTPRGVGATRRDVPRGGSRATHRRSANLYARDRL